MNAVILFSHGSLLCGAGEALLAQASRLRERGIAPIVEVGYLNYSEPPFADTVAQVVRAGAARILVTPYFLVPGKFVKVDLPKAVAAAQTAYPNVEFVVAEAIGFDPRLADALLESASRSFGPERWREDLTRVSSYCRPNPECPLYNTAYCPKAPGDNTLAGLESIQQTTLNQSVTNPQSSDTLQNISANVSAGGSLLSTTVKAALLVMIHGSPRPIANADMFRVVEVVKSRGVFPIVEVGFMECNEPSIPEAIDRCVEQGASCITAVPYFLHTGTHVADDLPTLMEEGRLRHPNTIFSMGEYLGRSESLTDILETRILAVK